MQQLSPAIIRTECASKHSDKDVYGCFRRKDLHFIHLNTRSVLPKIDELCHIATETGAAVISVTGTWLDSYVADSEIEIPGYMIQRKDRRRTGEGVYMYIYKDLAFIPSIDLSSTVLNLFGWKYCFQNSPDIDWSLLSKQNFTIR